MIILDTALHILQLIQDSKHIDELAQGQEVGLRDKVLPPLGMAQPLHLTAEPLDGLALQTERERLRAGSPVGWLTVLYSGEEGPESEPEHLEKGKSARRPIPEESLSQKLICRGKTGTCP